MKPKQACFNEEGDETMLTLHPVASQHVLGAASNSMLVPETIGGSTLESSITNVNNRRQKYGKLRAGDFSSKSQADMQLARSRQPRQVIEKASSDVPNGTVRDSAYDPSTGRHLEARLNNLSDVRVNETHVIQTQN